MNCANCGTSLRYLTKICINCGLSVQSGVGTSVDNDLSADNIAPTYFSDKTSTIASSINSPETEQQAIRPASKGSLQPKVDSLSTCKKCNSNFEGNSGFCEVCNQPVWDANIDTRSKISTQKDLEESQSNSLPKHSEVKIKSHRPYALSAVFLSLIAVSLIFALLYTRNRTTKTEFATSEASFVGGNSKGISGASSSGSSCVDVSACLQAMLTAMFTDDLALVKRFADRIDTFPKPQKGNTPLARSLNEQGLKSFKVSDFHVASQYFSDALVADPFNEEVAANLGFSLLKYGDYRGAERALLNALAINPRRTSTWVPIAELMAKDRRSTGMSVSALLIAYEWSTNKGKAIKFYESQSQVERGSILGYAYEEAWEKVVRLNPHVLRYKLESNSSSPVKVKPSSSAKYQQIYDDCMRSVSFINNSLIYECSGRSSQIAQKDMNVLLSKIFLSLKNDPLSTDLFKRSQSEWEVFLDAEVKIVVKQTGDPMTLIATYAGISERIDFLNEYLTGLNQKKVTSSSPP